MAKHMAHVVGQNAKGPETPDGSDGGPFRAECSAHDYEGPWHDDLSDASDDAEAHNADHRNTEGHWYTR